jgi:hypothetical protein
MPSDVRALSAGRKYPRRFDGQDVIKQDGQVVRPGKLNVLLNEPRLEVLLRGLLGKKCGRVVVWRSSVRLALGRDEVALGLFNPLLRDALHRARPLVHLFRARMGRLH